MWNMVIPILVIVASNTIYNICAKSTPSEVNAFASLAVTYGVGMICALVLFYVTGHSGSLAQEVRKMNWTSYVLGIAIVGLEAGFLYAYRAGWRINSAQLVGSIAVSCVLIVVGFLVYKETLTAKQALGMVLSGIGLVLISM